MTNILMLRFKGTGQFLGWSYSDERVAEEQPIDPTVEVPRHWPEALQASAEGTKAYYERVNPGVELELVSLPFEWLGEREDEPTPEPEPEPAAPKPGPEPAPEPEPSGLTLHRIKLDGGETVRAEHPDAARMRFRMADYTNVEGAKPFHMFGDIGTDPVPGKITGTVSVEALDASGRVIATASL